MPPGASTDRPRPVSPRSRPAARRLAGVTPCDPLGATLARTVAARAAARLPAELQASIEQLSGFAMDDVRVAYDSPHPARLHARAYARGTEIHLAPGSERDLPHEAWHVAQQKRGAVAPTMTIGGEPGNAAPVLEREADLMGERASRPRASGALRQLRHDGVAEPVIQPRWLITTPPTQCFWEADGQDPSSTPLPPWVTSRRIPVVKSPARFSVDWDGRPQRGVTPAFTPERFAVDNNLGKEPVARDTYNPYGRFATSAATSFFPARHLALETQVAILAELEAKHAGFQRPQAYPDGVAFTSTGYALKLTVADGSVLEYAYENEFGAVYESDPSSDVLTVADPADAKRASKLGIAPAPEDFKISENFKIDPKQLAAWLGQDRSRSQDQVMGASAVDVAVNAGFDRGPPRSWEWLHLIAHSMGGSSLFGPQVASNLVLGTAECNSQMISVEERIKDYVVKTGGKVALIVHARLSDKARHLASDIVYDYELYNAAGEPVAVVHCHFQPLSRRQPDVVENRVERYTSRAMFSATTPAATQHVPRSQPTAHTTRDVRWQDFDDGAPPAVGWTRNDGPDVMDEDT